MKSFLLGALAGLLLALGAAVGTYVSPLRETLYLDADPEVNGLRDRLEDLRERLARDELDIAAAPAGDPRADSLKAARAGVLKEYRHRRNRMGELSRLHEKPSPAGFAPWALSLREWLLPGAGLLILLPGLLSALMGARRARRSPIRPPRAPATPAEALVSFESVVKQVALLSPAATPSLRARSQAAPGPAAPFAPLTSKAEPAAADRESRAAVPEKRTEYLGTLPKAPTSDSPAAPLPAAPEAPESPEASPYEAAAAWEPGPAPAVISPFAGVAGSVFREPETSEFPLVDAGAGAVPGSAQGARPAGLETQYLDLGPGWGAPARPVREAASPPGLSMEDEEGPDAEDAADPKDDAPAGAIPPGHPDGSQENGGAQNHFMPPTTEVERVERRKTEVLKLARKGLTSSEISRRLRISQDQVDFIIRMRREKG